MRIQSIVMLVLSVGIGGSLVASQQTGPPQQPLIIPSMSGQDLFGFYCATCHGRDAKGSGPVASALKTPPADLTLLARRNRGLLPREQLIRFIANGGTTSSGAHGSNQMPVWGPIFVSLDPSDRRAMIRIENVVQYLETLQVR